MVQVQIGGDTRDLNEVDRKWIVRQLKTGSECVRLTVTSADGILTFQSGGCPVGIGGGRSTRTPSKKEKEAASAQFEGPKSWNDHVFPTSAPESCLTTSSI
jgi:hypothetical protein